MRRMETWLRFLALSQCSEPSKRRRDSRGHRRHRERGHIDVCGRVTRWPHARDRFAGEHLDSALRRGSRPRASPTSSTTPVSPLVARREIHRLLRVPRRRFDLDGCAGRIESAQLTWGAFDDRDRWSHDGTRSRSPRIAAIRGQRLQHLDARHARRQLPPDHKDPADDYMPSWSPDDIEIAFVSTRESRTVWAVNVATGAERRFRAPAAPWTRRRGAGRIRSSITSRRRARAATRSTARRLPAPSTCLHSAPRGPRRQRSSCLRRQDSQADLTGGDAQTIEFSATMQVTRADSLYTRKKRDFTSLTPRPVLGVVRPSSRRTASRSPLPRLATST